MTTDYYNDNGQDFIDNTKDVDMSVQYKFFEKYLPKTGRILDIGFGSGRDSLYFSSKYEVISIDNAEYFINEGRKILNNKVILLDVRDMTFKDEFDGIWACASLLHIPSNELALVFNKCGDALKQNGVIYASFKLGDYEGYRNGRFFTDLTLDKLHEIIKETNLNIIEHIMTEDVRPDRAEQWLNVILKLQME